MNGVGDCTVPSHPYPWRILRPFGRYFTLRRMRGHSLTRGLDAEWPIADNHCVIDICTTLACVVRLKALSDYGTEKDRLSTSGSG